jgi:Cse1
MFRSDALYNEMNYMIENLSPHLIQSLINATQQLIQQHDSEVHIQLLTICNCVLHIIESILSQEELPDFYEENLKIISDCCNIILQTDFPQFNLEIHQLYLCKARGKVVRLVHLYQSKFAEYFKDY